MVTPCGGRVLSVAVKNAAGFHYWGMRRARGWVYVRSEMPITGNHVGACRALRHASTCGGNVVCKAVCRCLSTMIVRQPVMFLCRMVCVSNVWWGYKTVVRQIEEDGMALPVASMHTWVPIEADE